MNIVKLQDIKLTHRNPLHSSTLTTRKQKEKLRKQFHSPLQRKGGSDGKASACNAGDPGSIPGLGRSPGEGKGYSLQGSGLENSMECIAHGVAKSRI